MNTSIALRRAATTGAINRPGVVPMATGGATTRDQPKVGTQGPIKELVTRLLGGLAD